MIVYTLTEIFHSDLQQVRIFSVFHAVNFLRVSQLPVPVPELGINNAKLCSIFKSPLMLSMIVTNGGNKLFPVPDPRGGKRGTCPPRSDHKAYLAPRKKIDY